MYLHFQNKKIVIKTDTFDFKSLPAVLLQLYPLHHLIISPPMFLIEKLRKQSLSEEVRWNKAEQNITHLNLSYEFDLSNYLHILLYIYIYIYIFGPVKLELGAIPSGQKKKTFNSEHLNSPGKELNVTDITEQYFLYPLDLKKSC